MRCFGGNGYGQLGYGHTLSVSATSNLPYVQFAEGPTALPLWSIKAGASHTCVLTTAGRLRCWGDFSAGVLAQGTGINYGDLPGSMSCLGFISFGGVTHPVIHFDTLNTNACAVFSNGRVKCWGQAGSLLGTTTTLNKIGEPMSTISDTIVFPFIDFGTIKETAIQVAQGCYHSCVLFSSLRVACMGDSAYIGIPRISAVGGTVGWQTSLDFITFSDETPKISRISAGRTSACALLVDNSLRCWGSNGQGELGTVRRNQQFFF